MLLTLSVHAEDEWQFVVSPYLWMAGQSGDVATLPGAQPAEIDIEFEDIIEHLDTTFMGLFEARKDKLVLFSEIFYIDIETDKADTPRQLFSDTQYEQQMAGLTLGGGYRWNHENIFIDFIGGVRYWEVDNELRLDAGLLPAEDTRQREHWIDPILGLKSRWVLSDLWSITAWLMSAVGGDSDSASDLFAGVNYLLSKDLSLSAGYRHQTVDYDKDGFLYDVEISGPLIGVSFVF
jgi:hypothetical protein